MKIVKEYLEIFTKAILKNVSAGLSLPESSSNHIPFSKREHLPSNTGTQRKARTGDGQLLKIKIKSKISTRYC